MKRSIGAITAAMWCVWATACAGTATSPTAPTSSSNRTGGGAEPQALGGSALPLASSGGPAALSKGLTDLTLANAGWTCIQPGNGLTLCAPPGTGLPSIPPAPEGRPKYEIMAFTADHQFDHHIKLLRPDLYHGQPCLGDDPWIYVGFLDYYECLIPRQD